MSVSCFKEYVADRADSKPASIGHVEHQPEDIGQSPKITMTIISLCSCLQSLELAEHASSVSIHSHDIECPFIITIIQIVVTQEFLSTLTTVQQGPGSQQISVSWISHAWDWKIIPQMLTIF